MPVLGKQHKHFNKKDNKELIMKAYELLSNCHYYTLSFKLLYSGSNFPLVYFIIWDIDYSEHRYSLFSC